ncbi:hypothetical protein HTY61_11210 [Oricola thermophila]|uniref:Uncharacterized protein n=2 Tax=Oricola thermophila TaxID=2742145 RepID=A0A6N1VIJ7_9HYPH|nr:hypothetical protein HTY61_11210 [Oricola thermophila]
MIERDRQTPKRDDADMQNRRTHSGLQAFAPWLRETRQRHEVQLAADEGDRVDRHALAVEASDSPLNVMYMAMGHGPDCIARMRRGLIVTCDCATKPVDDPAVAVALALRYERFARAGKARFTQSIARLVEAGAGRGDEACRMMLERLHRRGLVEDPARDGGSDARPGRLS